MEINSSLESLVIKIAVLILLGFSLWFGRKTCNDVMLNIDKFGGDSKSKNKVATRALFNFWIGFATVMIIVSGIFELLNHDVFLLFFSAALVGLGLKLTKEFEETRKEKDE